MAQASNLMMPRNLNAISGRGSSKTTEFLVERLIEMAYDMPGAPIAWASDTFTNLNTNVLPMVIEGLERKGFKEGVHFVIEKTPPLYNDAEKESLPQWLKPYFWKPFNHIVSYKRTMVWFTGLNVTFGSLDRPSSLAGRSYVHVIGDEAKYFKEDKIGNLLKAVRGYAVQYGSSPFYRGQTFTTDMPNINNIGEHDWMIRQGKRMDVKAMMLLLQAAIVVNDIKHEIVASVEDGDIIGAKGKRNLLNRWEERLYGLRMSKECHTLFFIASSFINADILTNQWFADAFESELNDTKTAILSMRSRLEGGDRFYANLGERHFYRDGNDDYYAELFGLKDAEDCRILKYLNKDKTIDMGLDFGNMLSLVVAQPSGRDYRLLKTIHTLSPEFIRELADKFLDYFRYHNEKVINFYYDRAGNNYNKAKQDLAGKLKEAIERNAAGVSTGWRVILMSQGQGNIPQNEEYIFMQELLSGHNKTLPNLLIDYFNCKPLRCSLEITATRVDEKGLIIKDKRSEKLPIHRLPLESSNFSDAFKYLMMRKSWRALCRGKGHTFVGDASVW